MVFNWKATAPVDVDFHTVPEGKPISASETFMRGKASTGQGTYRAPYPGLHGWYWKNTGKEPVTITLYAAGFFSEARMFSGDPVGEPMEVRDPDRRRRSERPQGPGSGLRAPGPTQGPGWRRVSV